jgi:hypothetical protein
MKALKIYVRIIVGVWILLPLYGNAQPTPLSKGVYRIPYEDGTQVNVAQDHLTHSPLDAIDFNGVNGNTPYSVVAAADGWVRYIDDGNDGSCFVKDVLSCSSCNNYVWIEHPNGEWSKYTHFVQNSVRGIAGISEDQYVCAGTFLGFEGDVGATSGSNGRAQFACTGNGILQQKIDSVNSVRISMRQDSLRTFYHAHFEVGIPDDLSDPITTSGFLKGKKKVPVFCGIPGNIADKGEVYTANPCDAAACTNNLHLPNFSETGIRVVQVGNEITSGGSLYTVEANAQVLHRAGKKIILQPGFTAKAGAYYNAYIAKCNSMPGTLITCEPIIIFRQNRIATTPEEDHDSSSYFQHTALTIYPNPFSGIISIHYLVREEASVHFILYDVNGREVGRPVNHESKEPGSYQITFDGSALPKGIYLYHLQIGTETLKGKLIKAQ